MNHRLWYNTWTEEYMEGLPTGNGRIAAMMLGRPESLRIALNHEWMWRGENRFRDYPDMSHHLPEVREALLSGDFLRGTELANRYFGGKGGISGENHLEDPYQPVGDLHIVTNPGDVRGYTRSLDLNTGLAEVRFAVDSTNIVQRMFISCTDGCAVIEMTSDTPCDLRVLLNRIDDPRCTLNHDVQPDSVRMAGAFIDGIHFEAHAIIDTNGSPAPLSDGFSICQATKTLILLQIGTDAKGNKACDEMAFPDDRNFGTLFSRHAEQFRTLKGTASVEVELPESDLPTDERILRFRQNDDPSLPLLYFEYGRYLMVSGSSAELPLNLQGKWNEDLQPPWDSDYHLDINLQMCYWFVETLGMSHAADTLFNLLERYVPHGRLMARRLYGCRGFTLGLQTDVWGRVTPESYGWAVWIGAAPWLAEHFYRHWRYTKDTVFLRKRCYPFLKGAAEFYEDYLIERNGQLWIVPSQSPENRFEGTGNWPVSIGYNSAMDIELINELLHSAAECADILSVDAERAAKWRNMAKRLPPLSTDSRGRLNEWDSERAEVEPGHRHISHLYGVYPSELFTPGSTEWIAAERSLDERLRHGGGHTGWSRSWVACMMARLGRAEDAWHHFIALIGDFATISLLDLHPPRIFQIDGNMGGTAAVCEMLMHSSRGELRLLPALPKAWPTGQVRNFRGQDGISVSFSWKNGILTNCKITSPIPQTLKVISGDREWNLLLQDGVTTIS